MKRLIGSLRGLPLLSADLFPVVNSISKSMGGSGSGIHVRAREREFVGANQ